MYLIGVDVGGTFTDIVFADTDSGRSLIHKVPTTPDDPSRGVIAGIVELCARHDVPRAAIDHVLHGTTIATNAVLEHRGAVTGMITTEGYRDIVHIGRHQRPQHYSIRQEVPWQDRPLVRRRHRLTVAERLVPPRGEVLVPLDEAGGARRRRADLRDAGVEAIAICFLFSYLNPAHEARAARTGARGMAGMLRLHLGWGIAAIPRVRAVHDGVAQRVCRAAPQSLCRPA